MKKERKNPQFLIRRKHSVPSAVPSYAACSQRESRAQGYLFEERYLSAVVRDLQICHCQSRVGHLFRLDASIFFFFRLVPGRGFRPQAWASSVLLLTVAIMGPLKVSRVSGQLNQIGSCTICGDLLLGCSLRISVNRGGFLLLEPGWFRAPRHTPLWLLRKRLSLLGSSPSAP